MESTRNGSEIYFLCEFGCDTERKTPELFLALVNENQAGKLAGEESTLTQKRTALTSSL